MTAYYNEIDPKAAAWLRELIKAGAIAPGDVDERDIRDVRPSELDGFAQCHFFAGIGVWSYALRLSGWPDPESVWTGSCPCQPFSAAGKGGGFDDERHLWPAWFHLIEECRPPVVFGEQVASPDGLEWLDLVQTDMEATGHAFAPFDLCAAGFGAPHIRQRLFWVADANIERSQGRSERGHGPDQWIAGHGGVVGRMADSDGRHPSAEGLQRGGEQRQQSQDRLVSELADNQNERCGESGEDAGRVASGDRPQRLPTGSVPGRYVGSFWEDAEWLYCRDDKYRPVEPQPQQMADGSTESMGRLCDSRIAEVEREIANAFASESDAREAVCNLWRALSEEAIRGWPSGRPIGVYEAPVLLAFLRQLQEQGRPIAQGIPRQSKEDAEKRLRRVWVPESIACPSRQRGLDGQSPAEYSDPMRILSSILARHAQAAWGEAFDTHARTGFPLTHGSPARVGRLRGYGNAIVAEQAAAFIEAYMQC